MKAQDLMTRAVVTAQPGTAAKDAARLLVEHGFTTLPVVDGGDRLVGVVAEADLLRNRVLPDPRTFVHGQPPEPLAPASTTVAEVMTTDVVAVDPRMHVAELSKLMLDKHLRTVPVVRDGVLVGVVSRRDLLRMIAREDDVIATDVRRQLAVAAGRIPWRISVTRGVVTLAGEGADDVERHVATVVAGAVAGVVGVEMADHASTA
ncbi:CBS domain-containing protein [Saccharothrix sp. 6-C]|uniref:CBS domain-containing protein n=1 Tax=Saccharothrix sp. 6-C TaxID=2781735 RepID=UPI0019178F82|nr:CBS domain-containing protein [Saccharothrix sp. 6-C]QQQ80173.1 CBS domain-containing protein [Saccharothrix sp. 6-C]